MKWVLVDKLDNIVHTVDLNKKYTEEETRRYFINLKRIDEKEFNNLWKVMSEEEYNNNFRVSLQNRQAGNRIKWWEEEDGYLDGEKS